VGEHTGCNSNNFSQLLHLAARAFGLSSCINDSAGRDKCGVRLHGSKIGCCGAGLRLELGNLSFVVLEFSLQLSGI
jgi:hypothetical protein